MLNSVLSSPMTISGLFISLAAAIFFGILTSLVFSYKNRISSSLALTLVILPVAMTMVVIMVNGNLGISVAVAGSFTLVRFRSIAGTGREISAVFSVMTLGVICGMGYVGVAAGFFAVIAVVVLLLGALNFGESNEKLLKITIPEDYDYTGLFDETFEKYQVKASIERIKTTNLGSLIDVTYRISLPQQTIPKEMLDELRSKNGNLSIMLSACENNREAL